MQNLSRPQNIQFNMWLPRSDAHDVDWHKGFDESTLPWYTKVDWFEYSSWNQEKDSFEVEWQDDFDWI